jgi:hypothetical protein
MCQVTGPALEYLSLADSAILHARPGHAAAVFVDDRTSHLPGGRPYTYDLVRSLRNQPGGFWVASTAPDAAYQAVQGTCEIADDSSILLLTDGVTRLVELYGQTWESLAAIASAQGPCSLITAIRKRENDQPPPYGKQHDDATAICMTGLAGLRPKPAIAAPAIAQRQACLAQVRNIALFQVVADPEPLRVVNGEVIEFTWGDEADLGGLVADR